MTTAFYAADIGEIQIRFTGKRLLGQATLKTYPPQITSEPLAQILHRRWWLGIWTIVTRDYIPYRLLFGRLSEYGENTIGHMEGKLVEVRWEGM